MPIRKLKLNPGVNLEQTPTLNQTQFAQTNLVRFYNALIQKLGGWQQITTRTLVGTCRGLHGWASIIGNPYLAAGTEQRLQVVDGGMIEDITPVVSTTNTAVSFSTTSGQVTVTINDGVYTPASGDWINLTTQVSVGGVVLFGFYQVVSASSPTYVVNAATPASSNVTGGGAVPVFNTTNGFATVSVTLANHGLVAGNIVNFALSTTIATVVISGIYNVTSVTNANTFVITAATAANATTSGSMNGGNAQVQYLLPSGYAVNTALTGYGIGDYGDGDYGLSNNSQATQLLRQWSLDHFGQDLIASPTNGAIYYWQPPSVVSAALVSGTAPIYNVTVFVMPQIQIIVALGAETGGVQEPQLVRWCDAGDFTDWTATATNQAGSYQIPTGSRLMAGLAVGLGALIWSDVDLWAITYQGLPYVFGFNRIAAACGIISQRAAGVAGSLVVWLSTRGFFQYSQGGGVVPLKCPVWDFLFNNIDTTQLDQVHCGVNSLFNEMAWFFPLLATSALYSASAPMAYVKFNYVENVWDYGLSAQYQRTAWVGKTPVGNPIGADLGGLLQQHETGTDANGTGMQWSWQTGYFDLMEGEEFAFVDMIIPDYITTGQPTINHAVISTYYPNAAPSVAGPFQTTAATTFFSPRVRGRQIALGASGSDLGTFNRLGALRYRYAGDGRN
jgi:hypothetical protein